MVPFRSALASLTAIALLAVPAHADSAAAVEARFFAAQRAARTVAGTFEQALSLPGMPVPARSTAKFFSARPDRLLIRYSRPAGDFLLVRDGVVTAKKGRQPAASVPLARDPAGLDHWLALLQGRQGEDWERDWKRTLALDNGQLRVTLEPRVARPNRPRLIVVEVDVRSLALKTLTLTLPNQARARYVFTAFQRDATLPADVFARPREEAWEGEAPAEP